MKIAISGHRPEKIHKKWHYLGQELRSAYELLNVDYVIQGMAAGVDLFSAVVAHELEIPYLCAKPWAGHKPRVDDKILYSFVEDHADSVYNVNESETYPGPWAYQDRNIWMVDHADAVIAIWDGSSGGTGNCVRYAKKVGKPVFRIHPDPDKNYENGWL